MTSSTFTVATPTYNRADTLPRVYESLCAQRFRDFEWIVVDDGSTDGTGDLVRSWQARSPFPIRYFWQENQHKKVAVNRAVREAHGEFIAILDSDDSFLPDALHELLAAWNAIPIKDRQQFAGVTALVMDPNGTIVGDRFPCDPFDVDGLTSQYVTGVRGEKFGMHRVEVMRETPFPEFVSGLVPENQVWDRIALRFRTRHINRCVRVYYPTEDSLINASADRLTKTDYDGCLYAACHFMDHIAPVLGFRAPRAVFDTCRQYWRFRFHMLRQRRDVRWWPRKLTSQVVLLAHFPIGLVLYSKDRFARHRQMR
jgi:glycosyltransferase involved in cell wall biosynthesis